MKNLEQRLIGVLFTGDNGPQPIRVVHASNTHAEFHLVLDEPNANPFNLPAYPTKSYSVSYNEAKNLVLNWEREKLEKRAQDLRAQAEELAFDNLAASKEDGYDVAWAEYNLLLSKAQLIEDALTLHSIYK